MAAIGSLIFCTACGNLLPVSKGSEKNILHCDCCGSENKGAPIVPNCFSFLSCADTSVCLAC